MKYQILVVGAAAALGVMAFGVSQADAAPKQNSYACSQLIATANGPVCLNWVRSDRGLPPPPFMAQAGQQQQAVAAPRKGIKKKKHRRARR